MTDIEEKIYNAYSETPFVTYVNNRDMDNWLREDDQKILWLTAMGMCDTITVFYDCDVELMV